MKVIPKLQQGNTIESDNTKVVRPEIHEPIKGAKARFRASMSNETNPLVGIERTILPSAAGAALVTTPAAVVGGALGNMTVDKLTGGWGNWLEDKTGIPSEIGVYTNPGAWYGGAKGYKIGKNKLITKSIKGDADLAWNPINKNHWIFNKEARTPSNIAMATANRITPFLSKVEKLPLKVAAKRTNGNASVSLQDIKTMPADYTGSSILGGGNLEGRNLLAKYIFDENPVVKRMFFNKATSNIKPISRNEARRGFSHGDRYEQLYPGVHNRRYEMSAVVPSGRPLKFENVTKFTDYAGKNPIGKVVGKETEPVMRMGDKEFMTFRQPGTDYIGPIDDVAGHLVKFQMNKGKLRQTSQDMWKFNPADYAKRWNDSPNTANQVRLIKQAALMDKVGRPFILQQSNPIWIEGKSVRNPELVTMAHGGRFDFKKSPILKKQEELSGKRDMRKKFIKSSRPTYKKRIKKAQQGMRFVSYNPVSNPTIDYTDITNPINPFSEYNYNTTYDKPEALVVPVRDTNEPDVVANNPTVEPVINKPVASKPVTDKPVTANSTWKSPYTNRKQWATELINAYKKAGITNDNAIRMLLAQDALESSWGRSAQGKYNFGNLTTGSSWKGDYVTGNDKNAKGEAIKQKFRSYNSMDEYAADKIQFLKRLYDFDENDDINKFVAKLTGSNKGKRRYAEATNYAKVLTGVYNGIPKGENGMIIKYQNPAQPIKYMGGYDKRGNIVLPVTNENGMNNVTLPEVTVTPRNINLAGAVDRGRREAAPYVSTLLTGAIFGPLSVAGGYAGNEAVNKITNVASNDKYKDWADMLSKTTGMNPVVADFFNIGNLAGGFGMRNFGPKLKPVKDMAVGGNKWARVISKTINKGTPSVEPLPNNVGWGPRQSIHVVHDKNSARLPKLYFPERWDAIHEGAPEVGIWYQGKFGNPRTAANHSVPGKAEKGAKPLEKSQFIDTGTSMNGDLDINKNIQNFVEYLLNPETQQRIASIDAELGTKYGEAAKRFVDRYNNGNLTVLPRNKRDVGLDNDIIKFSRSVPSEEILTTKDFDRIAFEILRDDFAHVPGHEAKHGIETVQAALLKDMTPTEYHQYAKTGGPRLQALMKDNIVSEDEFVKRIMKEHPEYNEVSVRNKYKYLTIPSEFNSQLHPLIEFEQRAGKSGVPNFKSVDEIDRLINNNPYVGTSENNGLRNLRLLFNYIIKDKNEFMRRFNKYGFGVVPATTIINNYDNE